MKVERGWIDKVAGRPVIRRPVAYHGGSWPRGWPIGFVWHYTAGCGSDLAPVFEARRISAHLSVDREGNVFQYVPLTRVAWHADNANGLYIGIEHTAYPRRCDLTDTQLEVSAELVAGVCAWVERRWGFTIPLRKIDGPALIAGFHDHADGDGQLWNLNRHVDKLYRWSWDRYLEAVAVRMPKVYVFEGRRWRRLRRLMPVLRARLRASKPGEALRIEVE